MRVYNLSTTEQVYRGRPIKPNGGSADFPDLTVVPARDLANRNLAFGSLPKNWGPMQSPPQSVPASAVKRALPVGRVPVEVVAPAVRTEEQTPEETEKKKF